MNWLDIASILFACTAANHLGLVYAIEGIMGFRIPILNCSKCASFWFTLAYCIGRMGFSEITPTPLMLAISFLNAYLAVWLELGMGYIDTIYNRIYDTLYTTEDDKTSSNADEGDTAGSMPELPESGGDTSKENET